MPLNRDPLARQLNAIDSEEFRDQRDSLLPIGLSLLIFAGLEYFVEVSIESLPGGLVFPVGFLLFWAFYYTYYRPNRLESGLKPLSEMSFPNIFGMVFSVAVWFVKVTVVGVFDLLFVRWWKAEPQANRPAASPRGKGEDTGSYSYRFEPRAKPQADGGYFDSRAAAREAQTSKPTSEPLPPELRLALNVLGLESGVPTWDAIHKRYRELAKKFHPDLNQEITRVGNRFIKVDQAYRTLTAGKGKFFK